MFIRRLLNLAKKKNPADQIEGGVDLDTCSDVWPKRTCNVVKKYKKCHKPKAVQNCALTCGHCTPKGNFLRKCYSDSQLLEFRPLSASFNVVYLLVAE